MKDGNDGPAGSNDAAEGAGYLTFLVSGQLFGIPVLHARDVLNQPRLTPIALAPMEVVGALNLRGRIVTAIDARRRLGMPASEGTRSETAIVVDHGQELYSVIVDSVGEVMNCAPDTMEKTPPTVDAALRSFSKGVFRIEGTLLVVLDIDRFCDLVPQDQDPQ